jgi:hypothetical protein
VVERLAIDEPARRAVAFQLEVPAQSFTPGTYTCQVNAIDSVAGRVAFPRLTFSVRWLSPGLILRTCEKISPGLESYLSWLFTAFSRLPSASARKV